MAKGYPTFECIPGISIIDKENDTQIKEDEISSTHEDEHDDAINENGEEE